MSDFLPPPRSVLPFLFPGDFSPRRSPLAAPLDGLQVSASCFSSFLLVLLASVFFTPSARIAGHVPARLDDLLVFLAGAVLAMACIARARLPRLDAVSFYLVLLMATILLSTLLAPLRLRVPVTSKEYLDLLRPLKFLFVYWAVRELPGRTALHSCVRTLSISLWVLLAVALAEMLLARLWPGGPLSHLFALYADPSWTHQGAETAMAQRPFATFNTPTHLGYVATICLFLSPVLATRSQRRWLAAAAFLTLLLSVTRTLLFGLPLLFVVQAFARGGSFANKLRRLRFAIVLTLVVALLAALLLPLLSPRAAGYTGSMIQSIATGNTQDQYSITTRLDNLALVVYTWNHAPIFGVATRSLLPDFVDSEVILTFHRYGMLGLAMLCALYLIGVRGARRVSAAQPAFSAFVIVALAATFLYGLTQGALINSRMGVLPFVLLGVLAALERDASSPSQNSLSPSLSTDALRQGE
jgi:hypothetical protein